MTTNVTIIHWMIGTLIALASLTIAIRQLLWSKYLRYKDRRKIKENVAIQINTYSCLENNGLIVTGIGADITNETGTNIEYIGNSGIIFNNLRGLNHNYDNTSIIILPGNSLGIHITRGDVRQTVREISNYQSGIGIANYCRTNILFRINGNEVEKDISLNIHSFAFNHSEQFFIDNPHLL